MTNVDPLSVLSKKISDYQAPSGWDYDPHYEATTNTLLGNIANLRSQSEGARTQLNEDYTKQNDEAAKANTRALDALYEKMAGQGLLRSGITVGENTRQQENYQGVVDNLAQAKSRGLSAIDTNIANQVNEWQGKLSQAQADRASHQAEIERQRAADEASAKAVKDAADLQRQWMTDLQNKLISAVQPQPQPTGQITKPPPVVPANVMPPAPAAKTPQQQIADIKVDPTYLQKLLQIRGFDPGPVDGVFGKKSQLALARWKQSVGLPATADINPDIFQKLLSSGLGTIPNASGTSYAIGRSGPARASII